MQQHSQTPELQHISNLKICMCITELTLSFTKGDSETVLHHLCVSEFL